MAKPISKEEKVVDEQSRHCTLDLGPMLCKTKKMGKLKEIRKVEDRYVRIPKVSKREAKPSNVCRRREGRR